MVADGTVGGKFKAISRFFTRLYEEDPNFVHFPEPTQSILITWDANAAIAATFFGAEGFKVQNSHCYLGGFVGEQVAQDD